jgi:hypothetical protein
MLAITDPKLPDPITPMGLSNEFLKFVADQAVVVVVEYVEILCNDISFFVFQEGTFQVEGANILQTAADDQVGAP